MTRRGAIMAGAVALAFIGVASIALAKGHSGNEAGPQEPVANPHGSFTVDTDYCGSCHSQHEAVDDALNPFERDRRLCLQCHSGQEGASNILVEYRDPEGSPSPESMGHRVPPDGEGLACTACHTPHQSAEENPGLLRAEVFNPDNGHKVFIYNADKTAIGNGFCYSCHGPKGLTVEPPPPGPLGDFTAFEAGAHSDFLQMQRAAAPDPANAPSPVEDAATTRDEIGRVPAELGWVERGSGRKGTGEPAEPDEPAISVEPVEGPEDEGPTGKIVCLFCHGPHDSDYNGITNADQEALCYRCHSKADPNTAEDTSPYRAFNVADNSYTSGEGDDDKVTIFHHPIATGEQQEGERTVECVSCHNPHFDAATDIGNNAVIANPRRTTTAWPVSATKRGNEAAIAAAVRAKAGGPRSAQADHGPVTYNRWARALLNEVGAPSCQDNLVLLVAWQTQEGTAAVWNPLATTYDLRGATSINSSGVKNYLSMAQGLEATRLTLTGGSSSNGYAAVIARLMNCAPAMATAEAVRDSSWCAGCTDGRYLTSWIGRVEDDYRAFADTLVSGGGSSFEDPVETVNTFCTMCHVAPDETNPIEEGDSVPYGIHLVNDENLDPGGQPHDLFEAAQFEQSLHAGMACTACHDVHGSSNAYALRESITAPDGSHTRAMVGFTGVDQPEDREKYGSFCLACHNETAEPHVDRMLEAGNYCRECHYHGSEEF